jgi:WD40 repeat protein
MSPDGRYDVSGSGYYLYKDGKIVLKDGRYVYTDCVLRRWNLESGTEAHTIKDDSSPFYSTAFSADARQLHGGQNAPLLRRWNIKDKTSEEVPGLKGTYHYVHQVVPTPDGKALITRGLDGKIIVWDVASGRRLFEWVFPEHIGRMAVSADSRHLAVGLTTGVVYILRLGQPALGGK